MKTVIPTRLVAAYRDKKKTIYDIGTTLNRSPSTVYNALRRENVDTTQHRYRKGDRNAEICKVVAEGGKLKEVGKRFGMTKQRVHQIVRKHSD